MIPWQIWWSELWYSTPNRITLVRLVFTPLVLFHIWKGKEAIMVGASLNYLEIAFFLFAVGALTDWLDGWISRLCIQITNMGKILDPLVDKVFFLSVLFFLVPKEFVWFWGILFALELILIFVGALAFFKRDSDVFRLGANRWGKIKVWMEVATISLLFINSLVISVDMARIKMTMGLAILFALLSIIGHLGFRKINGRLKTA